ncbi:hypothetical protein P4U99_23580 [Brevibacillus agri]|nr:hypothetical protein [Brevibacillus agri]MED1657499.1 hypothetical protein [Brevibacillus agri]MED1690113.1 hypothetical protein [Brevibacillus agri]MED1694429.1 hypothetical protein [Brevibacillus agri]MED1700291.1 hypothetical protein [Brevibacillus agri]
MLEVSRQYCDETVLTLDDVNGEPYEKILGWYHRLKQANISVIADRTLTIKHAWEQANRGDCIVVTGKGPEMYQIPFELPTCSDLDTIHYLKNVQEGSIG